MSNTCTFTGTVSKISDYALGSKKKITGEVEIVKKGKPEIEKIENPSWVIGAGSDKTGVIKDYKITANVGEIIPLPSLELEKNPVHFKIWKNTSNNKAIKCSGNSSQGSVKAEGNLVINHNLEGIYEEISIVEPYIEEVPKGVLQHFNRGLFTDIHLKLKQSSHGNLGMLHLMKSKVTRSHSNNNEEVLIDTMGKFVLRLPYKDAKDPICDKVKITNGIVTNTDKVVNNIFKVNLDISQTLCNTYDCYKFEEEYRSYLFFKGEKEGDIWHPVGFDGDQTSSPSYIKWEDKSTISYNKGNEKWYFKNHNKTSTKFCAIDNLPTWDKNIYDCLKKSDLKISNTITQYATLDDTTIEKINQLDFENNSDFIEAPSVPLMDIGDLHVSEYTVQHI